MDRIIMGRGFQHIYENQFYCPSLDLFIELVEYSVFEPAANPREAEMAASDCIIRLGATKMVNSLLLITGTEVETFTYHKRGESYGGFTWSCFVEDPTVRRRELFPRQSKGVNLLFIRPINSNSNGRATQVLIVGANECYITSLQTRILIMWLVECSDNSRATTSGIDVEPLQVVCSVHLFLYQSVHKNIFSWSKDFC